MIDITAVGEILIDLTQSGVNELGIPVFAANPGGQAAPEPRSAGGAERPHLEAE